jgi:hypothetical protein
MSDKELLELAAKAAGLSVRPWPEDDPIAMRLPGTPGDIWNPLHDDGDALRLAVRLSVNHDALRIHLPESCDPWCTVDDYDDTIGASADHDPCTATRRAIVRAAAEIGKAMQ